MSLTYKILVVDDMKMIRNTVKKLLLKVGCVDENIYLAENGKVGLDILEDNSIDLIICDWNMPEMTGLEMLMACKKDENLKEIPFIVLTSETDKVESAKAFQNGADKLLIKPLNEDDLQNTINSTIKK